MNEEELLSFLNYVNTKTRVTKIDMPAEYVTVLRVRGVCNFDVFRRFDNFRDKVFLSSFHAGTYEIEISLTIEARRFYKTLSQL